MNQPHPKFVKTISKYKERFALNLKDFKKFLTTRVQLTPEQVNNLMKILSKIQDDSPQFSDQYLNIYLHMIAAFQKGVPIEETDIEDLKKYTSIKFLGKDKKSKKIEEQIKHKDITNQQPVEKSPKIQTNKNSSVNSQNKKPIERNQKNSSMIKKSSTLVTIEQKSEEYSITANEKTQQNQFNHQSEQIKVNDPKEFLKPDIVGGQNQDEEEIQIPQFDKIGQDFMNPIIKYQIHYRKKITWRRYSEFEKLMKYLERKYEGIILPELPPKQGIKGGIYYFWGFSIDTVFLNDRKQKLQIWLNRLNKSQFIKQDDFFKKFISDENFEVPDTNATNSYLKTLAGYTDIVFNYNQLKDYGMAYYNYLKQYKTKNIETPLTSRYSEIQKLIETIIETNEHRKILNQNFNKRREILYNYSEKVRPICRTQLDKILERAELECQQLIKEYKKYLGLKMHESWLMELMKQKKTASGNIASSTQEDYDITIQRINKIQQNLMKSFENFEKDKRKILDKLGECLIEWRCEIHP